MSGIPLSSRLVLLSVVQPHIADTACFSTSAAKGDLLVGNVLQAVVRDDDERIDLIGQERNAGLGLLPAVCTLEAERLRHDADGQDAGIMRKIRNDQGCAGAGAAGQLFADHQLVLALGFIQGLAVGMDNDELHALDTTGDHSVDYVISGAADTEHLDIYYLICTILGHFNFLL